MPASARPGAASAKAGAQTPAQISADGHCQHDEEDVRRRILQQHEVAINAMNAIRRERNRRPRLVTGSGAALRITNATSCRPTYGMSAKNAGTRR
jgi:hypothetical protein